MGRIMQARKDLIEGDKHVQSLTLVTERDVAQRLDLKPFAAVYALAPAIVVKVAQDIPEGAPAWVYVASLVAAGALHALCLLACVWSTAVAVRLRYVPSTSVHDASHIVVHPHPTKGQPAICKVVVRTPPSSAQREAEEAVVTSTTFSYQQRTYVYDHATGQFSRQRPPVDMTIEAYRQAKGLGRAVDAAVALHQYGKNQCRLPRRDFYSSLIEQFSGPFFVFQVFCVLLWLLDDMWHYALFTGVMLVFFECTVAMTRVRNAEQLYKMEPKPQPVLLWREGKWQDGKSTELLPGDLFAMRRKKTYKEGTVCPCDGVIISGACVMNEVKLTGESIPQMKESIASEDGQRKLQLGKSVDKNHIVYAGTKLVMVTAGADERQMTTSQIPEPEPGAVLVYALRTGFDTSQGKLMRTILFASDAPVTANSAEAFIFIAGLLVFAVAASGYVLMEGLKDPERSRWKLFLNCTMILTSVIPPELPMELSLAVNNSLMALMKLGIFCTEPFRIPSAGKVDICCFDKTGTLTSEKMIMHGIAGVTGVAQSTLKSSEQSEQAEDTDKHSDKEPELIDPTEAPLSTAVILAACHSLVVVDRRVFGDPLERVALEAVDWDLGRGDKVSSVSEKASATVLVRHHFDSSLRRMSVIADVESPGKTRATEFSGPYVLAKGAPETMESRFDPATLPADFRSIHRHFSLRGNRVLALGYKRLDGSTDWDKLRAMPREDVEQALTFAGFVVLTCPLKAPSAKCISGLKKSGHEIMMITGDHMLTACYVAQTLRIISQKRRALVLHPDPLEWRTVDAETPIKKPFSLESSSLDELEKKFSLCVGGDGLAAALAQSAISEESLAPDALKQMVSRVKVFARTSPEQKEAIVGWLKDVGRVVLMCGDGTNDVGALKAAQVGVGLLEADDDERQTRRSGAGAKTKTQKIGSMQALLEAEADMNTVVQLGDASIASPFTSKQNNIKCTLSIIRQGRCTLATTTQMFKIIAINCLITAYSLSVLYLDGVKFGDSQATMQGLVVAGAFLCISRSSPLEALSEERPHATIFTPGIMLSMVAQFGVHMVSLMVVCSAAKQFERTAEELDPEADFKANVLNSSVFLLSTGMLMTSFLTNYRGAPFMEGLLENKALLIMLGAPH
eukprot:COSAG03_NODE_59_length_15638_cov_7.091190_2_plen_1134_part_00